MRMHYSPLAVRFQQSSADVEASRTADLSGIEQNVVRRTATDVDIQYAAQLLLGQGLCPRAVTGNHRFQMRTGAGNHEVPQRLRERHHRRTRISGFGTFSGDDDRAGIDSLRRNTRRLILGEDQRLKFGLFQPALLINGGKEHRALPANFAFDEFVARHLRHCRTVDQLKARENDLSGGGADIDTDAQ